MAIGVNRAMTCTAMALFVSLLVASGCGGGRGRSDKSIYIARADRICQTTRTRIEPLVEQLAVAVSGSVGAEQARKLAGVAARLHTMGIGYLASLERLEQPSGDRTEIRSFLTASRQIVDALGQAASDLRTGNVTGALALMQAATPTAERANAAAQAYGFKQCVSVLPSGG